MIGWLLRLLGRKRMPPALASGQWGGTGYIDRHRVLRHPSATELMAELKGTAWTCASINASVCASFPPRLYVTTARGQARPKCATAPVTRALEQRLRSSASPRIRSAEHIEEVADHPLLDLLRQVNPVHNGFDLWELTTLYLEVHGKAFWYLDLDPVLGVPREIWPLPAQNVSPRREANSTNLVDYYLYRAGFKEQRFRPEEVIFFRYPDPRDPYSGGLSPLRACYEQALLTSQYTARRQAIFENDAIPAALVTPDVTVGEEERDRLQTQWNQFLQHAGAGRLVIAESAMRVHLLQHSLGDLALLADMKVTKEDIANAFHVPLSFLTSETNLANLQAAEHQHMAKAIRPRLLRRDEKLNEQLIGLYDPTGRLFLASEDPVPLNFDDNRAELELFLKHGVLSINEVRSGEGLPAVEWGDVPWLPLAWARTDYTGRADAPAPKVGRNRPGKNDNEESS